jgi:transposase
MTSAATRAEEIGGATTVSCSRRFRTRKFNGLVDGVGDGPGIGLDAGRRARLRGPRRRLGRRALRGLPEALAERDGPDRPHPGAQLRFDGADGMCLTCFAINTPGKAIAGLELRHRRRAWGLLRKWILIGVDHGVERGDLTDAQWVRLEPLLPKGKKQGRSPKWTRRQLIDGMRWRTRAGTPWRDVPERYGPWDRVYDLFRRWQRDGTWHHIAQLQSAADAKDLIIWDVSVDSHRLPCSSARGPTSSADAASSAPFQRRPASSATARSSAPEAADHRHSTRTSTSSGTRSNATSIASRTVLVAAINEWL